MTLESPLVSVLVSTYNAERFLVACLDDLQAQTIANQLEIIVIDSGSQQNERGIVEQFQKRYSNIIYVRTERETLYAAWNRGIQMARGKYITNANSDDAHRPDALEKLVGALEHFPEADLAYGDYFTTTVPNDTFANPRVLRRVVHPPYHPATLLFFCVTGCHPMWRRTIFEKIGLFNPDYTAPGDYEFLLRFAQAGCQAVHVPDIISLFYQNPEGLSFRPGSKADEEFKRIQTVYRAQMPIERLYKIEEGNAVSIAAGWVALGNHALHHQVPWFDNTCQNPAYAIHCYAMALEHDPQNVTALHNLVVAKVIRGERQGYQPLMKRLPGDCSERLEQAIARGFLEPIHVNVSSAIEPLEFGLASPKRSTAHPQPSKQTQPAINLPVRLLGPFFDRTENGADLRGLLWSLSGKVRLGTFDQTEPLAYSASLVAAFSPAEDHALRDALKRFPLLRGGIAISHAPAPQFSRIPDAIYSIGRTSFSDEVTRQHDAASLPLEWVRLCNLMDEIWVPTKSELELFANAGVERDKLFVVARGTAGTDEMLIRLEQIERQLTTPIRPATKDDRKIEFNELETSNSKLSSPLHISWEGSFLDLGSLSHVNRELTQRLAEETGVRLTCVGKNSLITEAAAVPMLCEKARQLVARAPKQTQVTIRHAWPPSWTPPESGGWILIQPWEYGALPAEWTRQLGRVDEIWAPSEYVRRVYVDSGVPPNKVKVVPNGIDPKQFHPAVPPLELSTRKSCKFLFVGGTIARKGADVLLESFLEAFTAADDVCLVIKDFGAQNVYQGQTLQAQIKVAQRKQDAPEIIYLDRDLSPTELAGLYTGCDCLVHPYRGEGFALPVLEAMACGLPVVVTAGGATDDFATDDFAFRIPALRKHLPGPIGGMALVRPGWWLEPDRAALIEQMRWIAGHRDEARQKGERAGEYVRQHWTWARAAQIAAARIRNFVPHKQEEEKAIHARRARKSAPIDPPTVARLGNLQAATQAFRSRNFDEAWQLTSEAIRVRPFHPEAWLLLAEIAQATGGLAQARQCAERARQLAPKWKPAKRFIDTLGRDGALRGPPAPTKDLTAQRAVPANSSPTLSVCLIVKNEERSLGRCLESVRGLASQVIVMDTGSTDATITIARKAGAEIYSCAWQDDFSAARNSALEHATGDWILILDADEELSATACEALKRNIQEPNTIAYRLRILDKGKEDEGHSYVPRLFRNAPGLFFVGRVHEQIFSSVEVRRRQWEMENRLSDATILHHGYSAQIQRERGKVARNLALLERAVEEMPNEPHLLMNYGLELIRSGQMDQGLAQYREAVCVMSSLPADQIVPELRETLLTQLGTQLLASKDFSGIVNLFDLPLARSAGLTASMHFLAGLAHMETRRFREAATHFRQTLAKRDKPALSPVHKDVAKAAPRHCLALCLKMLQQADEANKVFAEALKQDPPSRPLRYDYARFLVERTQPIEALQIAHQLVGEQTDDPVAWLLGGQIALAQPDFLEFACDWTCEAIKHLPHNIDVVALRAEALLLSGQIDEALPLWRRVAPAIAAASSRSDARALAAMIICEVAGSAPSAKKHPLTGQFAGSATEPAFSQEFLRWYRKLVDFGASAVICAINANLARLRPILPSASQVLEQAMLEAERDSASDSNQVLAAAGQSR